MLNYVGNKIDIKCHISKDYIVFGNSLLFCGSISASHEKVLEGKKCFYGNNQWVGILELYFFSCMMAVCNVKGKSKSYIWSINLGMPDSRGTCPGQLARFPCAT